METCLAFRASQLTVYRSALGFATIFGFHYATFAFDIFEYYRQQARVHARIVSRQFERPRRENEFNNSQYLE